MGRGALLSVGPGARTLFTASEEAELVARALRTLWEQPPEETGLQGVLRGLEAASLSSSPQTPGPGTDEPLDDALPWRPALEKAALKDQSRLNDGFVPPSARRQAIRNFSWVDGEYEVQLRVPLPAGVLPPHVQGQILGDGLELLAVEEPAARLADAEEARRFFSISVNTHVLNTSLKPFCKVCGKIQAETAS